MMAFIWKIIICSCFVLTIIGVYILYIIWLDDESHKTPHRSFGTWLWDRLTTKPVKDNTT